MTQCGLGYESLGAIEGVDVDFNTISWICSYVLAGCFMAGLTASIFGQDRWIIILWWPVVLSVLLIIGAIRLAMYLGPLLKCSVWALCLSGWCHTFGHTFGQILLLLLWPFSTAYRCGRKINGISDEDLAKMPPTNCSSGW